MTDGFSEKRVADISQQIAEAIEDAGTGRHPWTLPAQLLTDAFPGGFAVLLNNDFVHETMNLAEWASIDQEAIRQYTDHYFYVNPWTDGWTRTPSGSVFIAEKHLPASTFAHTEFYNDWLLPQGDVRSGVGLKVDAGPTDMICFPVHYPRRFAAIYDRPAAEVSQRLIGVIKRAIRDSSARQSDLAAAASGAAVIGRSWPALVVDAGMRLCNANREGDALLARDGIVRCKNGKISFVQPLLNQQVATAVASLAASSACSVSECASNDEQGPLIITLSRLPRTHPLVKPLVSERKQILLLIKRLAGDRPQPDLMTLAQMFGFTPAELRLCASLLAGRNLQESAIELGVTYETIRHRIKTIFHKAGLRSQSDLVGLLNRYAR